MPVDRTRLPSAATNSPRDPVAVALGWLVGQELKRARRNHDTDIEAAAEALGVPRGADLEELLRDAVLQTVRADPPLSRVERDCALVLLDVVDITPRPGAEPPWDLVELKSRHRIGQKRLRLINAVPDLQGYTPASFRQNVENPLLARLADRLHAARTFRRSRTPAHETLPLLPATADVDIDLGESAAEALRPRYAIVPYVGHELLLADLAAWCEREGQQVDAWFVTGPGGIGKTRFAIEACLQAQDRGWTAGLLEPLVSADELTDLAACPDRLLIAIDYAEARQLETKRLLSLLARRSRLAPARLLLLVRTRASQVELLSHFQGIGQIEEVDAILRGAPLSALYELNGEIDRLKLYDSAFAAFSDLPKSTKEGRLSNNRRPRLHASHFERPLFVLAAAYLAARNSALDLEREDEVALLENLIDQHEVHHWRRSADAGGIDLDIEDQRVAVALATLLGAEAEEEAIRAIRLVPGVGDDCSNARALKIARWVGYLYSGRVKEGWLPWNPLEPDLLGETLVAAVLRSRPYLLTRALELASSRQTGRLLRVIGRAQSRLQDVPIAGLISAHLTKLVQYALVDQEVLAELRVAISIYRPEGGAAAAIHQIPSVVPGETRLLAADLSRIALEETRRRVDDEPTAVAELVEILFDHAQRVAAVGQQEEAYQATVEGISFMNALSSDGPEDRRRCALSLALLGTRLEGVERPDEAVSEFARALEILRLLEPEDPVRVGLDIASVLNDLAIALDKVGRHQEAAAASGEAVERMRKHRDGNELGSEHERATVLLGHAGRLRSLGNHKASIDVAQEAVDIARALHETDPGTNEEVLADALVNLGAALAATGRLDESLPITAESVALYQKLAAMNPIVHGAHLAAALNNFANRLSNVGALGDAVRVSSAAVAILRKLVDGGQSKHREQLANALINLAGRLSGVGQYREATFASSESVEIYRRLADASPEVHSFALAKALRSYGLHLGEVGGRREGLVAFEESVALHRQAVEAGQSPNVSELAFALVNLAIGLSENKRFGDAREANREAIEYLRDLARQSMDHYRPALALALKNESMFLGATGQSSAALAAAQEAVDEYQRMTAVARQAHQSDYGLALQNLGAFESAGGSPAVGLARARQALEEFVDIASRHPRSVASQLGASLANLLVMLDEANEIDEADVLVRNLVDRFAGSDAVLGNLYLASGWRDRARGHLHDAIADYRLAIVAFDSIGDLVARGAARQSLRTLRQSDALAFDSAWGVEAPRPAWLEHLDVRVELSDLLTTWLRTPDWPESMRFLEAHRDQMLTDEAEAVFEQLIDRTPESIYVEHLEVLRAARREGVEAAQHALHDRRMRRVAREFMRRWMSRATWRESEEFAMAHSTNMTDPYSLVALGDLADSAPRDSVVRLHRGLLWLGVSDGFPAAYQLVTSESSRRAAVAAVVGDVTADRAVAVLRLASGIDRDLADVHFDLALAALQRGDLEESAAAMADASVHAAPYERREFLERLAQLVEQRPDLDTAAGSMQQILMVSQSEDLADHETHRPGDQEGQ